MEAVRDQLSVSRKKRKEEGRRLKRQRIEAAGGTRPREKGQQREKEQKVEKAGPKDNNDGSGVVRLGVVGTERVRDHSTDGTHREDAQQSRRSYNDDSEKPHNRSDERTTNSSSRPLWKQDSHGPRRWSHQKHQQNSHHNHRFGRVMEQVPCRNQPRLSTLSVALPGSVVSNCQTRELRTHLVGQIARAATIYHVDEIIIYDDKLSSDMRHNNNNHNRRPYQSHRDHHGNKRDGSHGDEKNKEKDEKESVNEGEEQQQRPPPRDETANDPHLFMARVLQYCECPQYLRRHFFPMHPSLQFAGLLPPIDAPHHVRAEDHCRFREGVVLEDFKQEQHYGKREAANKTTCLVNCGIRGRPVEINAKLQAGIRCTVELDPETAYGGDNAAGRGRPHQPYSHNPNKVTSVIKGGLVVSPSTPRERDGTYWGYTTRLARSIQAVFDECPFRDASNNKGYDLTIGTSERGDHLPDSGNDHKSNNSASAQALRKKKDFKHALIVFGGVAGIEECIDADETMKLSGAKSNKLFDAWVNVCPFQGSRTIRTEEAVLITLARFGPMLFPAASASAQGKKSIAPQEQKKTDSTPVTFTDESVSEESSSDESDDS